MCNINIWRLYALQDGYHKSSCQLSPYKVAFFSLDENFKDLLSWQFSNMCNIMTIVTLLYITPPWLIYFGTGSLYLLTYFTHATHPSAPLPSGNHTSVLCTYEFVLFYSLVLFLRFTKLFEDGHTFNAAITTDIVMASINNWLEHWIIHHCS